MDDILGLPQGVNLPVCMAPMVGISHWAFRQVVREYLPMGCTTLWPSEMLNSRRIPDERLGEIPEAMKGDDENFWMPQILANEEKKIELSLEKLFNFGAQGIDINMGCPVTKALKHNYGVALMGDPDYAAKVVAVTKKYSQGRPVSVKLRGATQRDRGDWLKFLSKLQDAGADWIVLHPRTPSQKRRGSSDWSQFVAAKSVLSVPLIGNGDIQTSQDAVAMMRPGDCSMAMVGRALTARPWLFWQVAEDLGFFGKPLRYPHRMAPRTPEEEAIEYGQSLLRLLNLMESTFSKNLVRRKFIFHVKVGAVWLPFGHSLYSKVSGGQTVSDIRDFVEEFFSRPHSMRERTFLRQ